MGSKARYKITLGIKIHSRSTWVLWPFKKSHGY